MNGRGCSYPKTTIFSEFSGGLCALITAWLQVQFLPGPPRSPAQIRFPAAGGIVFKFPRLWRGKSERTQSLSREIDRRRHKLRPSLWPRQTLSRRSWRLRQRLVRPLTETGSSLVATVMALPVAARRRTAHHGALSRHQVLIHRGGVESGRLALTRSFSEGSMKKAIAGCRSSAPKGPYAPGAEEGASCP